MRKNAYSKEYYMSVLEGAKKGMGWKMSKKIVLKKFGSFDNLKCIELGAGKGTTSLLFALEGAEVSVLDYSQKGLNMAKKFFNIYNIKANFILMDALNMDDSLFDKFDVSLSGGTVEHFDKDNILKFISNHFNVLKTGGMAFIGFPNKLNLPYRLWKFLSQSFGRWKFGEENPQSFWGMRKIGRQLGVRFNFFGGFLFHTKFHFIDRITRMLTKKPVKLKIKEFWTPLDKYFASGLVAYGTNQSSE